MQKQELRRICNEIINKPIKVYSQNVLTIIYGAGMMLRKAKKPQNPKLIWIKKNSQTSSKKPGCFLCCLIMFFFTSPPRCRWSRGALRSCGTSWLPLPPQSVLLRSHRRLERQRRGLHRGLQGSRRRYP